MFMGFVVAFVVEFLLQCLKLPRTLCEGLVVVDIAFFFECLRWRDLLLVA